MVRYRIPEIAGRARVEPVGADGLAEIHADCARVAVAAEAERAKQVRRIVSVLASGLTALWRRFRDGQRRRVAIAQLAGLDDWLLRDIGLERSQIAVAVDGLLSGGNAPTNANRPPKPRGLPDAA